jgi:phytoene desaturase
MHDFMYRDYRSVFDFLTWRTITRGSRLRILEHIDKFVRRYFEDDRIAKIMEYTMVFLGGSPKNTPALYAIMSHVDFDLGVWYPYGGLGRLVEAFKKLCEENRVKILPGREVLAIRVEGGHARAVATRDGDVPADLVVVNADYQFAETNLLEEGYRTLTERYWRKRVMGPSAFILYLGLNRPCERLRHHNLYLDSSWDDHFRTIFDEPGWPERFSYYVGCPSRTDRTVAPEGGENLFVLVPVAPGLGDDDAVRESFCDRVLDHLTRLAGMDLRSALRVKRVFSHRDFIEAYHAFQGTALGMSHTLTQTGSFRPPHRSRKVDNLWYVGNYTHPGVGLPMVIISGQITSDMILKEYA